MAGITTTLGIILLVISLLSGVCLLYYCYKFWNLKHEMIYIKRRGNIVIAYTLSCIVVQLFGNPLVVFLYWDLPNSPNKQSMTFIVLDIIDDIVFGAFFYLAAYFALLRYWMMFYDIQFSNCCIHLEWKQCINNNIESLKKEQWFIQHRANFGNPSFMIKRLIILSIITTLIIISSTTLYSFGVTAINAVHIFNGLMFTTMAIILVIIWKKMPFFNDHIYLYKEFQIISYFWICSLLAYAITISIAWIFGVNIITLFIGHFIGLFIDFIIPFLSTYWVLMNVEIYENINNLSNYMQQNERQLLSDILKDEDTLNLFMRHLIDEFSMECLLAIIEFQQFKELATTQLNINATEIQSGSATNLVEITFPENIPQSDIVYSNMSNDDVMLSLKQKAYRLYNKYISSRSDFQINISYGIRSKLDGYMINYDEWISVDNDINDFNLVNIFDAAMHEMVKLLNHSKGRFKYQKV